MEKKLEVKNLQVSFRTQGGNVKAVRDISFDLYKGETLAIVGAPFPLTHKLNINSTTCLTSSSTIKWFLFVGSFIYP